jgi:hypothetical protein
MNGDLVGKRKYTLEITYYLQSCRGMTDSRLMAVHIHRVEQPGVRNTPSQCMVEHGA